MNRPTLLRLEDAARTVHIVAEFLAYTVIFGTLIIGWIITP